VKLLRIMAGLSLLAAAGCAPRAMTFLTPPEPPVVWPLPPDAPRVRYVGELKSSDDIGQLKPFSQVWDELLYGPKPRPKLVSPQAVAVNDAGDKVAVADVNGKCVHVFDLAARQYAALVQVADARGTHQDADESPAHRTDTLESPVAVCWAGERLWVADSRQGALAVFEPGGAGRWLARGRLTRPAGMAYCPANQLCYVADAGTHRVSAFDAKGERVVEFGSRGAGPGQFNAPSHMAFAPDNTLVIADSLNFRVQRLGLDGSPIHAFGRKGDAAGDLALPKGVAVDGDGTIWVVDAQFENVQAFTPDGRLLMAFGKEGHGPGEFWLPAGICIDNQRRMWVADRENARVQVFALLP